MKPQYQTRYELLHESYQKWLTGFTRHAVSWGGVSSEYPLLPESDARVGVIQW
ncbi:Uncharacterised protein [Escherichia coli]|uniref:Malate transporter n=1 Tax=Escherichia coli TaxID=562 RepID=A0A377KBP4_ECOLX|nr:Uncharacterised protein [Escherichia coli]